MLQGSFASGRYTSTVLFVLSMLVIWAAHWLPESPASFAQPDVPAFMGGLASRAVSVLFYVLAAVLLSRQTFFDREVKWKGALYMWLVALSTFINGNPVTALSALLFMVSIILLFFCQYSADPVGPLFTAFLLLGVQSFITPLSLYFIPLYLLFFSMANVFSARGLAASVLGLATPFWLIMGTAYVFPDVNALMEPLTNGVSGLFVVALPGFSVLNILLLAFVLLVLLPGIFTFVGSTSPAKPLLRRRLSFVIVADIYLLLLSCVIDGAAGLFYVCQLPFVAILASYLFAKKETKLSNVYFVLINAVILAIATYPLWLMR
ncbi:MAG: hypothetical protein IKY73_04445 [Bacteroidaceae bacterium]|nr:hypothetical protein [Bacteroidaceae bacterium]